MTTIDLCTIGGNSFLATWAVLAFLSLVSIACSSAVVFKVYFINVTFEKWQTKINPIYPTPEKVRDEIVLMLKGLCFSTLCPALSLYLSAHGTSEAYCTWSASSSSEYDSNERRSHPNIFLQFLLIVLVSDFYEWGYHRLGHIYKPFWEVHRHHHIFYNPSPFSVISDEYLDQLARALPLLMFPLVMPINMELMFGIYAILFYFYGVYLHCGHEPTLLFEVLGIDAHHPILNTSYQHYIHHATSTYRKPYHTGFFFKLWDQIAGSLYPNDKCDCIHQCQNKNPGKHPRQRTREEFQKVVKPDYSVLWKEPAIWWGSSSPSMERSFKER